MSAKMKVTLIGVSLILVVTAGVAQRNAAFRTTLDQSSTRLAEVSRHISGGNFRAAESLLFQLDVDLGSVRKWYTFPSVLSSSLTLEEQVREATARKEREMRLQADAIQRVAEQLQRHSLDGARAAVASASAAGGEPRPNLDLASQVVSWYAAQEFGAAAGGVEGLRDSFPQAGAGSEAAADLLAAVQVERARLAHIVRTAALEISDRLAKGKVEQAQKTVTSAQGEFVSPNAILTALGEFVRRVEVQDFAGAEVSLKSLPKELPDGSQVDDLSSSLDRVVETERAGNRAAQESIARRVKQLAAKGGAQWNFSPHLRGRAMVWDATKNDIEKAYELLPDDLRASSRDGKLTMFLIRKRWNVQTGTYSISHQPAFQEHMEIAVVYWPAEKMIGVAEVLGGQPASVRTVRYTPEYGSSVRIKEWIEKLPKE